MTRSRRRWLLAAGLLAAGTLAAAAILYLDSLLLAGLRERAAALSREWGRPVEVGGASVRLVPTLGIRLSRLRVGPGAGESLPLLELDRAEVRLALWRALRTRFAEVKVLAAELQGLRLAVERLADGTTNAERLSRAIAEAARAKPAEAPTPAGAPPRDLSFLEVDHASLRAGRIAFVDRASPGSQDLAVDRIDVDLRDVGAGRPLDLLLRAAVLAPAQNLELRLHASPLPPSLEPAWERLALKLAPLDLAPLAPFFPAGAGFLGGSVQADLEVGLGSAAPRGSGPTRLRGTLAARQLRFRGQQGGRPLDVALDADVEVDAPAGDLRIGKLEVAAGPARLTGRGKAEGLWGAAPRVEGLEVVATGLDFAELAGYYPPLGKMLGGRVEGPIVLALRAAGSAAGPALELSADLAAVRIDLPGRLAKAAGGRALLTARLAGAGGAARLEAGADLAGLDLRPGGSLAKAPGERLGLRLAVERRTAGEGQQLEVKQLDLLLPADALAGHGRIEIGGGGKRSVRFDLSLASERLDVDRLLLPAREPAAREAGKPADPGPYEGLSGVAAIEIGALRFRKVEARNVLVHLELADGVLTLKEARAEALGGKATAAGTRIHLARPAEPLKVLAKVQGVEAAELLALFSSRKVVSGKADMEIDLAAAARGDLAKSLAGLVGGRLLDGAFLGKDLVAGVAGPLARALPAGLGGRVAEGGSTSLGKELPFSVRIADGTARLEKPLRFSSGKGEVSVEGGGIRLDGELDLPVTVALSPESVAALTGGRVRPAQPVPVTFRVTGPAWSPSLRDLGLGPAVKSIVEQAAAARLGQAVGLPAGSSPADGERKAREAAVDLERKAAEEARKRLEGLFK